MLCCSACDLSTEHLSILFSFSHSSDQCRDSVTSYVKGEAGKPETNGSLSESTAEAKAKSYTQESLNDVGKQSDKEAPKTKPQVSAGANEQMLSSQHIKNLWKRLASQQQKATEHLCLSV